jgi:hypothetical protein
MGTRENAKWMERQCYYTYIKRKAMSMIVEIIELMLHTKKIWERVINHRLRVEKSIGESHFGFMPG